MYLFYAVLLFSAVFLLSNTKADDFCKTTVLPGGPPSVYHQYCCVSDNQGKNIKLISGNNMTIINCPLSIPSTCPYTCSDIYRNTPGGESGYYDLISSDGSLTSVYCDMEGSQCDGSGGWMRVGYVDMTQLDATCPPGLFTYQFDGQSLCDRVHILVGACNSTFFSTNGFTYTQVCGQVRGYQYRATDGIYPNYGIDASSYIDEPYVDGVSITHGSTPRQHIWTYAAGQRENDDTDYTCPCNTGNTQSIPSYIGDDYYCESGVLKTTSGTFPYTDVFFGNDPLWDGEQCNSLESPCCTSPQMPWFTKSLNQPTTDPIEVRLCTSEGYPDEATPVDIIELYIR